MNLAHIDQKTSPIVGFTWFEPNKCIQALIPSYKQLTKKTKEPFASGPTKFFAPHTGKSIHVSK